MSKSKFLYLFASIALIVSCGCEKKRELPDVDPPAFQRYSQDNILHSKVLNTSVKYSIYFPASYASQPQKRYPVVYMVHGYGDDNNSWNGDWLHANKKIDELTKSGLGEMIYVFPQGFKTYFCNRYDGTFSYMDMFVNELIPLVDNSLRTIPDKQHRAVTGYSMGGFGAVALAEKHPELFIASASLSMSVRTDWQYMEESQDGWNGQWGKIFGGFGQAGEARITDYYKQHCPLYYFNEQNKSALSTVHWYMICGDNEENLLYANDELHCVLRDNGYAHEYRVVDGGHSSSVWMPALDEVLPMFDYYINGGSLWNPTPQKPEMPAPLPVDENGCWTSPKFLENGRGTALLVAFDNNFQASDLPTLYAALQMPGNKDKGYIFLPCDLSKKDLAAWMTHWGNLYTLTECQVLGLGSAARQALECPAGSFSRYYFINPDVNDTVPVGKGQPICFAGTDRSAAYHGINTLYNLCKKNEAEFEYRIVRGCGEPLPDILSSLKSIYSLLIY